MVEDIVKVMPLEYFFDKVNFFIKSFLTRGEVTNFNMLRTAAILPSGWVTSFSLLGMHMRTSQ